VALIHTRKRIALTVLHSAAGRYIGTSDREGPVSRESVEYFQCEPQPFMPWTLVLGHSGRTRNRSFNFDRRFS